MSESQRELLRRPKTVEELEEEAAIRFGLPHLFAFKFYPWMREFFESQNKMNLLCAANQLGKSSIQIRKCIEWATNKNLWPILWPKQPGLPSPTPNQFWYLYPSQKVVNAEWETKWSQFLPKGVYKDDPDYGWKLMKDGKNVLGVRFFSGVILYFKTYSQKVIDLQSGTVFAMFCDEELPVERYDELLFRITRSRGYFHMVFTATLGQEFWRQCMEPMENEVEMLPAAYKNQVSLYDSMTYEDGTPGAFTLEDITVVSARCSTHNELLRRVYGRFITPKSGLKYPSFDAKTAFVEPHKIPDDWLYFSGVDVGGGGEGHPSGIMLLAVDPEYRQGRFFTGWRGDKEDELEVGKDADGMTTSADVLDKYRAMKHEHKLVGKMEREFCDPNARDFKTLAVRIGENFEDAENSHEIGDDIVNFIFKYGIVKLFSGCPQLQKFSVEISSIKKSTPKSKRKDDIVDAGRYAVTKLPWDMSFLTDTKGMPVTNFVPQPVVIREETADEAFDRKRREGAQALRGRPDPNGIEAEFTELNDLYGCS